MASIDFIQKRIRGKEKEIEKLEKKLARIRKAEATLWDINPYGYCESDLLWTLSDLENARQGLDRYRAELTAAQEKANSRNVPAILQFLDAWKRRCTDFYGVGLSEYFSEKQNVRKLYKSYCSLPWDSPEYEEGEARYREAQKIFAQKEHGYYEPYQYERRGKTYTSERKVRDGEYEYLKPYTGERSLEAAMQKLAKDLSEEADRKYDFIIERTNAIVGEITDASNLRIGSKADLNGYVIGTRGIAKVQTIGAGGYNIQCFHFRTLINRA